MIRTLFYIGAGSFLGGVARYGVSRIMAGFMGLPSVWGTFVANIAGCLFIGVIYGLLQRYNILNDNLRLFLTVGFCGGFTTFSTFINENYAILSDGRYFHMALYAGISLVLGLVAVHFGYMLSRL